MTLVPAAVIMAGGRASRLGGINKPVLKVGDKPLIHYAIKQAQAVAKRVIVALSPFTVDAKQHCKELGAEIIMTSGSGYVKDLSLVLNLIPRRPLLVLPSDTPFISSSTLLSFIAKAVRVDADLVSLAVKKGEDEDLIGVTLFIKGCGGKEKRVTFEWSHEFINVNTLKDLEEARRVYREKSARRQRTQWDA